VIDTFSAGFDYVANDGAVFYFKTNHRAPRYKVVAIDLADLDALHARATAPKAQQQSEEKNEAAPKGADDDGMCCYYN
jgi:hypothetical protein